MESYVGMIGEGLEGFLPEERHHVYKLLRLGVRFRPEWSLETADVAEGRGRFAKWQTFPT